MADIPVERRSTGNWWKWLLGLVLLALAIWLIAALIEPAGTGGELDEGIDDPIEQPAEQPGEQPPEQSSEQPGDDVGPPGTNEGTQGVNESPDGISSESPRASEGRAAMGRSNAPRAERIDITIAEV